MKIHVKQPFGLDGHDYAVGVHDIPDAHSSHWYFLAHQNNGGLVVLEAPKKAKAPKAVEVKSEPEAEEPAKELDEAPAVDESAPEEKSSKGPKKKKRG